MSYSIIYRECKKGQEFQIRWHAWDKVIRGRGRLISNIIKNMKKSCYHLQTRHCKNRSNPFFDLLICGWISIYLDLGQLFYCSSTKQKHVEAHGPIRLGIKGKGNVMILVHAFFSQFSPLQDHLDFHLFLRKGVHFSTV